MNVLGYDWPTLHAALNDLPAALLLATVVFDWGGWLTRRGSLAVAALWTLWAGVIGGWAAVVAGLQAEDVIEHGPATHPLIERHETLALITMGVFTVVLIFRLFRRNTLTPQEETGARVLYLVGLVFLIWTARVGGEMMFQHAAGVPTATLQAELQDRAKEHHHTQ